MYNVKVITSFTNHLLRLWDIQVDTLVGSQPPWLDSYCWWKESCTTWDVYNPVNNGIFTISTGAGFLPSTVCLLTSIDPNFRHLHHPNEVLMLQPLWNSFVIWALPWDLGVKSWPLASFPLGDLGWWCQPSRPVPGGSSQDLDTRLISMVIVSPQDLGLWDPFQMAELHGL